MNTIVVSYNSEVLGNGTFWVGDSTKLEDIRNIPARRLAEQVALDGKTREAGMWKAEMVTK